MGYLFGGLSLVKLRCFSSLTHFKASDDLKGTGGSWPVGAGFSVLEVDAGAVRRFTILHLIIPLLGQVNTVSGRRGVVHPLGAGFSVKGFSVVDEFHLSRSCHWCCCSWLEAEFVVPP